MLAPHCQGIMTKASISNTAAQERNALDEPSCLVAASYDEEISLQPFTNYNTLYIFV